MLPIFYIHDCLVPAGRLSCMLRRPPAPPLLFSPANLQNNVERVLEEVRVEVEEYEGEGRGDVTRHAPYGFARNKA